MISSPATERPCPEGAPDGRATASPAPYGKMIDLVCAGGVTILSGAGLSTESGIPDYRGPTGRARRAQPMTFQEFTADEAARQRYWARSHVGWRHVPGAAPNDGHRAVAELERRGLLAGIITQNVDGLHQAAGARQVTELHGSLSRVVCLDCGERTPRLRLDQRLRAANAGWTAEVAGVNPDGDALLADDQVAGFRVVGCERRGGVLQPDVVFFGENVPRPRVRDCYDLVGRSSGLLVLGSSLTVMSGLRFVRHAAKLSLPVVIVNQGTTRGDEHATATLDAPLGAPLTALVAALPSGRD